MLLGRMHGEGRELWGTQGIALQPWLRFLAVSGVRPGRAPRLEMLQPRGATAPAQLLHRPQAAAQGQQLQEGPGERHCQKASQEGQK